MSCAGSGAEPVRRRPGGGPGWPVAASAVRPAPRQEDDLGVLPDPRRAGRLPGPRGGAAWVPRPEPDGAPEAPSWRVRQGGAQAPHGWPVRQEFHAALGPRGQPAVQSPVRPEVLPDAADARGRPEDRARPHPDLRRRARAQELRPRHRRLARRAPVQEPPLRHRLARRAPVQEPPLRHRLARRAPVQELPLRHRRLDRRPGADAVDPLRPLHPRRARPARPRAACLASDAAPQLRRVAE